MLVKPGVGLIKKIGRYLLKFSRYPVSSGTQLLKFARQPAVPKFLDIDAYRPVLRYAWVPGYRSRQPLSQTK